MPSNKNIKSFFDQAAPSWDSRAKCDWNKINALLDSLHIQTGDRILDVACGTGIISHKLYERSKRQVTAIDLSEGMISYARQKGIPKEEVDFLCRDFYDLDLGEFDLIVVFNAYPHFLDLERFKKALLKNLSPDGRFAIVHDLGRQQLHDCHKGVNVSLLSRDLADPRSEAKIYNDEFSILEAKEGEDYYLLVGQKESSFPLTITIEGQHVDKRKEKTLSLIDDAFFRLLNQKDYSDISIADILNESKIARSTFYAHYKAKDEIISSYIKRLIQHICCPDLEREALHNFADKKENANDILAHFFTHIKEDSVGLSALFNSSASSLAYQMLFQELSIFVRTLIDSEVLIKKDMEKNLFQSFATASLLVLIKDSIENHFSYQPEEQADIFLHLYR